MGNKNVQLIGPENRTPDQKVNVVTRSGLATDGGQPDNARNSAVEWVRRLTAKSPALDLQKEKETFLHA